MQALQLEFGGNRVSEVGHKLGCGENVGRYTSTTDMGCIGPYTLASFMGGRGCSIAATAYDSTGAKESKYSTEMCATVPPQSSASTGGYKVAPLSGTTPKTVILTDTSRDAISSHCRDLIEGDGCDCVDGVGDTGGQAVYTCRKTGSYGARITVRDTDGTASAEARISVTAPTATSNLSASQCKARSHWQ